MMKLLTLFGFLCTVFTGFSQAVEPTDKKTERITLIKDTDSAPKKLSPAQEYAQCENQLLALDKKEAYIRSNPDEMKAATANNWFVNADKARVILKKRMDELNAELKK